MNLIILTLTLTIIIAAGRVGLAACQSFVVATCLDTIELEQRGKLSNRWRHWLRPFAQGTFALALALIAGVLIGRAA